MAKDLVFEIGTEEMPAKAVDLGIKQLRENAQKLLDEGRLSYKKIKTMGTPRRLVLLVSGLAGRQDELIQEVKGPAKKVAYTDNGEPTAAALGFAESQGVAVDALVVKRVSQGEYIFALVKEKGLATAEVLEELLPRLTLSIAFPKTMRWNNGEIQFVRPIRWLLALFGGSIVKFALNELDSGSITWGHRFLTKNPIKVESSSAYMKAMLNGKVLVDNIERAKEIRKQAERVANQVGGRAVIHPQTFAEVVQLVEYPHVISGSFSKEYVKLPRDVLITSLESHQRYFPIEGQDGSLLPFFIVVHNGDVKHNELIRRGHERVLRARLADAKFFFEEDQKEPLVKKVEKLKGVIFQEKLGTVFEKIQRVEKVVGVIAQQLSVQEGVLENTKRAAFLSKADLVTEMVVEFPTLQGVMGREYALLSGEKKTVAQAIFEHYLPRFANDCLPQSPEGKILSLADKIDSIVGCFSVGFLPTGSEDPYALRRQAQGVINIIFDNEFNFSLTEVLGVSLELYEKAEFRLRPKEETQEDLEDFFKSRLRAQFLNEDFSYDVIDAVLTKGISHPTDLRSRIASITRLRETSQMEDAIVAFTRCNNLAQTNLGTEVNKSLLQEKEEKELFDSIQKVDSFVEDAVQKKDYDEAIRILASLRPIVDVFFDEVLVMAEKKEVKRNRLTLLNKCVSSFLKIADFSELVVPGNHE